MTTDPRRVLAYFIATGDPPTPNANDKGYRGTFLSDSENREKARRIDREPLPVPTEHGRNSADFVKNNRKGYTVPPEERMADIYGALVPYDNRLLVLGKIYDCPDGNDMLRRMKMGIAVALSPYTESLIQEDAHGNPLNAFDLHTTHYGMTILPDFSAKNVGGDARKGTYIHDVNPSEEGMLAKLRELHLQDHVYVTPAIQEKLGLDDAKRAQLKSDFEDGVRIKRALYQKIHGEPMQPDGYDASLLSLFVEPTIELTDAIPVKASVGESVTALLEARRETRRAEQAAIAAEEEEIEADADIVALIEELKEDTALEEAAAEVPAEDPMETESLSPASPAEPPEKLNSPPLADTPATNEGQSLQAPTRVQPPLAFADLPALRPAVTASSLMSSPQPTTTTTPPPADAQQQQSSIHAPFRAAPQSAPAPDSAMDIDEGDAAAKTPSPTPQQQQQQAAPEMAEEDVMKKLAEISASAKLISSGEANLDPKQAYDTMTTLEGNLRIVNQWLRAHGMDPASLENPADFENYMHAKREIGMMGKQLTQQTREDILSFNPEADVSMYTPEKILDPHGSGYRPEQYSMVRVHASNVFSSKRRELEARLAQPPAQVNVNLQQGQRSAAPAQQHSVWGAPPAYTPVNLKRRLPDPHQAQSAQQEIPRESSNVYQGEAKRMQFAPVSVQSMYAQPPQQAAPQQQQSGVDFRDLGAQLHSKGVQVRTGFGVGEFWKNLHQKSERPSRSAEAFMRPYTMQSSQVVDPGTLASMQRIASRLSGEDMNYAEQLLQDHSRRMQSQNQMTF